MDIEKLKFPIGEFVKPDLISENDIVSWILEIEKFPLRIDALTKNLSDEKLNWIYRQNGWSIKQVVHHCADSHCNSFFRFKLALTEDAPTIKPYEEAKWAMLVDGLDNNIVGSMAIIKGVHYRWVLLLNSLDLHQLSRTFLHPETKKVYQLNEVIGLYAWHCNHHLAHIEQALEYKGKF